MKNRVTLNTGIIFILLAGLLIMMAPQIAKTIFMPAQQHGGYYGELEVLDKLESIIGAFYVLAFLIFLSGTGIIVYYFKKK